MDRLATLLQDDLRSVAAEGPTAAEFDAAKHSALGLIGDARATLEELAEEARALGPDDIIGIDLDYEVLGKEGSMLMVSASGTAVKLG